MADAIDYEHMSHALRLAANGLYDTAPNPTVGCVLVNGERVVGTGWTAPAGGPHAERVALTGRVEDLNRALLTQAERHKEELLSVYKAVGPSLAATADTLAQHRELLAQIRRDDELRTARAEGVRRET